MNDLPNILLVPRSAAALVPWLLVVVYIDIILSSWKRLTTGCGDRKKADGHPAGTCCRNGDIQLESKWFGFWIDMTGFVLFLGQPTSIIKLQG